MIWYLHPHKDPGKFVFFNVTTLSINQWLCEVSQIDSLSIFFIKLNILCEVKLQQKFPLPNYVMFAF